MSAMMPTPAAPPPMMAPVARTPPARPGGVTFACVASIVLGAMGVFSALAVLAMSAMFAGGGQAMMNEGWGAFPFGVFGAMLGAFFAVIGFFLGAMGALGIVAGAVGLRGASWARWTMVVLFALGALIGLASFPVGILWAGANIAAIVFLVNAQANEWFDSVPQ